MSKDEPVYIFRNGEWVPQSQNAIITKLGDGTVITVIQRKPKEGEYYCTWGGALEQIAKGLGHPNITIKSFTPYTEKRSVLYDMDNIVTVVVL